MTNKTAAETKNETTVETKASSHRMLAKRLMYARVPRRPGEWLALLLAQQECCGGAEGACAQPSHDGDVAGQAQHGRADEGDEEHRQSDCERACCHTGKSAGAGGCVPRMGLALQSGAITAAYPEAADIPFEPLSGAPRASNAWEFRWNHVQMLRYVLSDEKSKLYDPTFCVKRWTRDILIGDERQHLWRNPYLLLLLVQQERVMPS
jgi:hypothetical protein